MALYAGSTTVNISQTDHRVGRLDDIISSAPARESWVDTCIVYMHLRDICCSVLIECICCGQSSPDHGGMSVAVLNDRSVRGLVMTMTRRWLGPFGPTSTIDFDPVSHFTISLSRFLLLLSAFRALSSCRGTSNRRLSRR